MGGGAGTGVGGEPSTGGVFSDGVGTPWGVGYVGCSVGFGGCGIGTFAFAAGGSF